MAILDQGRRLTSLLVKASNRYTLVGCGGALGLSNSKYSIFQQVRLLLDLASALSIPFPLSKCGEYYRDIKPAL